MSRPALTARLRPRPGGGFEVLSPAVGLYAGHPPRGSTLRGGEACGQLWILGAAAELRLPAEAHGLVASEPPPLRRQPVVWGGVLLRLEPPRAGAAAAEAGGAGTEPGDGRLVYPAPAAGRFYRSPEPGAEPYLQEGEEIHPGRTFGLLEVMKTFNPLKYEPGPGLPERACIRRFLVEDGGELEEGQPLLELESGEAERA